MSDNLPILKSDKIKVLSNSLYVGASDESISMVLTYCEAAGLDVMQKPVHIVPMYCATGKKDSKGYPVKAMRDVVMPGIGLYRIQAARTGQYAGASMPQFGESVTESLDGVDVTYPLWCSVTVYRQIDKDNRAEFSSIEYWKENYASKGKSSAPNAMWLKRPFGQLAKCATAQALRNAFPEIGASPAAEEMEGKEIDVTPDVNTIEHEQPDYYPQDKFDENLPKWQETLNAGRMNKDSLLAFLESKASLTTEQIQAINDL